MLASGSLDLTPGILRRVLNPKAEAGSTLLMQYLEVALGAIAATNAKAELS